MCINFLPPSIPLSPSLPISMHSAVVSDTAMQRRVAELLIEKVHFFFPDLPETPQPSPSQPRPLSYTSTHGTNPSGVYTPTAPLSSYAPVVPTSPGPAVSTPSSSTSSSITEDLQAHISPSQTTPPLVISHEALTELRSSSPKPVGASPPIPPKPYKGTGSLGRSTNPPTSPRSAFGGDSTSSSRPESGEIPSALDTSTNGITANDADRPQPATRKKKLDLDSPGKVPGASPNHGSCDRDRRSLRGPSRRAPPPPVSKKPGATRQLSNEEVSTL